MLGPLQVQRFLNQDAGPNLPIETNLQVKLQVKLSVLTCGAVAVVCTGLELQSAHLTAQQATSADRAQTATVLCRMRNATSHSASVRLRRRAARSEICRTLSATAPPSIARPPRAGEMDIPLEDGGTPSNT